MKLNSILSNKYIIFLILFFFNYFLYVRLNLYEIISSHDLEASFVKGRKVSFQNLPYSTVWDGKGPLFFYMYKFFDLITFNTMSLINLLVILLKTVISYLIFTNNFKQSGLTSIALLPTFFYILIATNNIFGNSIYYEEIIILLLIFCIFTEKQFDNYTISGILIASATLITNIIYIFLPIFLYRAYRNNKTLNFIASFTFVNLITMLIFYLNDLFEIFIYTNVIYPFTYVSENASVGLLSIFYLLKDNLSYFSFFYFVILCALFIYFFVTNKKKFDLDLNLITTFYLITSSIFIPIISGKYYGHHFLYFLIFFLYNFSFFYVKSDSNFSILKLNFYRIISFSFIIFTIYPSVNADSKEINIFKEYEYELIAYELVNSYPELETIFANKNIILSNFSNLRAINYVAFTPLYFDKPDLINDLQHYALKADSIDLIINSKPDVLICGFNFKDFYESYCKGDDYFFYKDFNYSSIFINKNFQK